MGVFPTYVHVCEWKSWKSEIFTVYRWSSYSCVHFCDQRHAGRNKRLYITVQRALEINLLHSIEKGESEDLENFKKDNIELSEILKSADRPSVKEVTVSEISIPLAKIESLNELEPDKSKSGT